MFILWKGKLSEKKKKKMTIEKIDAILSSSSINNCSLHLCLHAYTNDDNYQRTAML